jgi:hypothetical protein
MSSEMGAGGARLLADSLPLGARGRGIAREELRVAAQVGLALGELSGGRKSRE